MKKNILVLGILAIGLGGIIFIVGFYVFYYFSIIEANEIGKRMACKEETADSFEGILNHIDHYEYSKFMHENLFGLYILDSDSMKRRIYYQFRIKENIELIQFAEEGQIIKKRKGMNYFEIYSRNGELREFIVPNCQE